jgi:hypothetical protein
MTPSGAENPVPGASLMLRGHNKKQIILRQNEIRGLFASDLIAETQEAINVGGEL